MLEEGLRYGLGSTLAVTREALQRIGGFESLVDHLADDYELGERIFKAGYRVALTSDIVETSVPAYTWRAFCDHQLRWLRTVRDARPGGYAGLLFTHGFALALLNLIASGLSPISLWLLALMPSPVQSVAPARTRSRGLRTLDRRIRRQHHHLARRALRSARRKTARVIAPVGRSATFHCICDGFTEWRYREAPSVC
jgi:GT2 family glycosyltransferase